LTSSVNSSAKMVTASTDQMLFSAICDPQKPQVLIAVVMAVEEMTAQPTIPAITPTQAQTIVPIRTVAPVTSTMTVVRPGDATVSPTVTLPLSPTPTPAATFSPTPIRAVTLTSVATSSPPQSAATVQRPNATNTHVAIVETPLSAKSPSGSTSSVPGQDGSSNWLIVGLLAIVILEACGVGYLIFVLRRRHKRRSNSSNR